MLVTGDKHANGVCGLWMKVMTEENQPTITLSFEDLLRIKHLHERLQYELDKKLPPEKLRFVKNKCV